MSQPIHTIPYIEPTFTYENIAHNFPAGFHVVTMQIFIDYAKFINAYFIKNNLCSNDIIEICLDLKNISFNLLHTKRIHDYIIKHFRRQYDRFKNDNINFRFLLNNMLKNHYYYYLSQLGLEKTFIHLMLIEFYNPLISFNEWREYTKYKIKL